MLPTGARRQATLQQKGAQLIDDSRPPGDESIAHAMQCLQIELIDRLQGHA